MSDAKNELFEESNEIVEPKKDETKVVEAEPEPTEVVAEPVAEPAETPPKPKKKKRVITDAERERLRANLAKGRATSLANRRKKMQLKQIAKEERTKDDDDRIFEAMKKKRNAKNLSAENDSLRKQLAELKAASAKPKEIVKPVKVKEKKVKSAATDDSDDDMIHVRTKSVIIENEKKTSPPIKKPMSQREILKLMRGL